MARGRPVKSEVRQNIVEILHIMGEGYAYEVAKIYRDIFAPVTMRSVYYHLKKGASIGEFKLKEVRKEDGEFSWGSTVEKIYYELGANATPQVDPKVKAYFDKK